MTPNPQLRAQDLSEGLIVMGKICIVDQDLASRGFLRECLEREGHQVVTLDSDKALGSFLDAIPFDGYILSVDAPGVREKDLLRHLRKTQKSRILLVVSERGDAFLKEAIDLGVYGFIYKPFDTHEICAMVTHLVR